MDIYGGRNMAARERRFHDLRLAEQADPPFSHIDVGSLADALGVEPQVNGLYNTVDLYKACMHIQFNDAFNKLPQVKRIWLIQQAALLLTSLRGSR